MSLPNNQMRIEPAKEQESGSIIKRRIWFHAKLFWSESEAAAAWVWCAEERGWVCQKNELWFSPLLLFVAIFGSHSRGGAFESWTLWARRPTLWGIHLAICESQQSPPLLTNLSSRHISQAHTTAVCLSISQFFVKYE